MRTDIEQRPWLHRAGPYAAVVLLSAFVTFAQAIPMQGTFVSLALTVLLLFYLPGVLLARMLGKLTLSNPVHRFGWILLCAFGLTVPLATLLRLLQIPVSGYTVILHLVMLVLAFMPHTTLPNATPWRLSTSNAPLYLLLGVCCLVVLYVGLERSQYRFDGYEDQTVFIEMADWLAHEPDDMNIRSRRIGVMTGDTRWDMDGWTYSQAAWVRVSGVPAAQLIWFDLTPLYVWTVPLAVFSLAYELSRREDFAALTVAVTTLFGLMTIDALVYYSTWLTFGQFSFFQINTLRTIATALVTPLALMSVFAYLREPARHHLLLILLAGITVATMHPRQIVIFLYSAGTTALLWWLVQPNRQRLARSVALILALGCIAVVPFVQRSQRPSIDAETALRLAQVGENMDASGVPASTPPSPTSIAPNNTPAPAADIEIVMAAPAKQPNPRGELRSLNLPLIGTSFIVDPDTVFYHPFVIIGVLISLFAALRLKQALIAQYLFASTVATLILLFVPGVSDAFMRLVTALVAPSVALGLPVPLALAYALSLIMRRLLLDKVVPACRWALVLTTVAVFGLLLFEPIPIPASAQDQIRASNAMQALRDIQPADELLLADLQAVLPQGKRAILLTPDRIAGYITESVPYAFVTGGRASSSHSSAGSQRFTTEGNSHAPWLDTEDINFMLQWGVTHIVLDVDDTRLTQLLLQPDRFRLIGSPAGYRVFEVLAGLSTTPADEVFGAMNTLYAAQPSARWGARGFDIGQPGTASGWTDIEAQWRQLTDADITRLGRAFTYLMMADDIKAFELWLALHQQYPYETTFLQAVAQLEVALGRPNQAAALLLAALDDVASVPRVIAARLLMTETFFYLVNAEQLQRILDTIVYDTVVWEQLANFQRPDEQRERIVLLLSRQQWQIAEQWSRQIPVAEVDPRDLVTRAVIALALGNPDKALAELQPATDPDLIAANRHIHPDRWHNNVAAQTFAILKGDLARQAGRWADAADVYQQAIAAGNRWAARYWLAETHRLQGRLAEADALRGSLLADWQAESGEEFPELVSLLTLQDTDDPYLPDLTITQDDMAGRLTIQLAVGNLHLNPLPVRALRAEVTDPAGEIFYASQETPVVPLVGAFARATIELALPPNLSELTPALVFIEPRYDNRVTFGKLVRHIAINRPGDATPNAGATTMGRRFGEHIILEYAYVTASAEQLYLTLYWQADAPIAADYQVFTHIVDARGEIVDQYDSAPQDGRYPTSQWRVNTLIADQRTIVFDTPLQPGTYRVLIGLYVLPNERRLPLSPSDELVEGDAFRVLTFNVQTP